MFNWKWGYDRLSLTLNDALNQDELISLVTETSTISGSSDLQVMFCVSSADTKNPVAINHFMRLLKLRADYMILLSVEIQPVPFIEFNTEITEIKELKKFYKAAIKVGYAQIAPDMSLITEHIMRLLDITPRFPSAKTLYLIGGIAVVPKRDLGMFKRTFIRIFSLMLYFTGGLSSELRTTSDESVSVVATIEI